MTPPVLVRSQYVQPSPRPSAWWWLAAALGLIVPALGLFILAGNASWPVW